VLPAQCQQTLLFSQNLSIFEFIRYQGATLNTITQSKQGLKHISFLRKIFLQKLTGKLHLNFTVDDEAILQFHKGMFLGDAKKVNLILRRFFTEPVVQFTWETVVPDQQVLGWVAPWLALSDALRYLPIDASRLASYHEAFCNLPAMVLKSCPVHRFDFADEASYLILYNLSLGTPSFDLRLFFLGSLNKDDMAKHIRAVLLVFLLGYLRSAPKKEASKNISIVSRILNRFKAKGSA
jgi:hypothetical protein